MARINEGLHSFTCHPTRLSTSEMNHTCIYSSPQFGWYSFPVPLMVGGWVGLSGLLNYWAGFPAQRRSPIPVLAESSRGGRESNSLPLSHESNAVRLSRVFNNIMAGSYRVVKVKDVLLPIQVCTGVLISIDREFVTAAKNIREF